MHGTLKPRSAKEKNTAIDLVSHDAGGITDRDRQLAEKIDGLTG